MTIVQEEIFGPVLSVIPFDDEDQAVELANSTRYGLACGLWTRDFSRAHRLSRSMQADTVWVNTYRSATQTDALWRGEAERVRPGAGMARPFEVQRVKNVMVDLFQSTSDPFSLRS